MNDCRGQLLQRVRRGLASDQEQTAFEAHLAACESCRITLDIANDFDQVGLAGSEDAELVARLAVAARHARGQQATTRPRRFVLAWPLAAAALVIAGAAVAGGVGWRRWATEPAELALAPAPAPSAQPTQPVPPARTAAPATTPAAAESEVRLLPRANSPTPKPTRQVPPPPPTADELYREANEARRAGQTALARAKYRELQQRYPGSGEARLSHVSLGRLLLQGGAASAALGQFDAYLAGGAGQRLAAEALFGRGQALQALGRSAEEVQNWRRLIGQYPDSAYATHASRRLEQLE